MRKSLVSCLALVSLLSGASLLDIREASLHLDANLTAALEAWKHETLPPIISGTYPNVKIRGDAADKTVALTFDDAPDGIVTPQLLAILRQAGIKASFFIIGEQITPERRTVVRQAYDDGHAILNHTFTHPRMTTISPEAMRQELAMTAEAIRDVTGVYPLLMRPPFGSIDAKVVMTVNAMPMTTVLWSLDSLDWALKEKEEIIEAVADHVAPGDIVLMHAGGGNALTVQALPAIIERLKAKGYRFVTVDRILKTAAYRRDDTVASHQH